MIEEIRALHLSDSDLKSAFDSCDFESMSTADDLFYLIARAVEKLVLESVIHVLKDHPHG